MGRPSRRLDRGAPARAVRSLLRPNEGAAPRSRIPTSCWSPTNSKLKRPALPAFRRGAWQEAAKTLHGAERIWIAGFRSCRSVAELLNYELRLFRPDTVQLVGGSGPEDLDLGAFRAGDAVIVIGFTPYSAASVLSARAARRSGAALIAIADRAAAPMADGADHLLLFEAAASPGFFPSLTGAIAIAQSLAAVTFVLGAWSPSAAWKRPKPGLRRCHNILPRKVE